MNNMMNNEQMDNILETNTKESNAIRTIKEIIWSVYVMTNYIGRRGVFDCRPHLVFVLPIVVILYFVAWSYEIVYDTNLYKQLANACWNAMNYNGNSMLNQSASDVSSQYDLQLNVLCFVESKLVESSERRMFLLLLLSCTLHLSVRRALWKYIKWFFKIFGKDEFWGALWGHIASYFKKFNEDELSRSIQATSPTVIDEQNVVCVINSIDFPWDSKHCVLPGGIVLSCGKYFHANSCKTGFIVFSGDLERFSGTFQYPLPKKKAEADRIGYCRNGIMFTIYHGNKEFVVKKIIYRPEEIVVYSQLCHPNVINLVAVLIGREHKCHKNIYYAYYFMPKMGVNFKDVLLANQCGCLKFLKTQLAMTQWELVLLNVKYILKCVLHASDHMNSLGIVHNNIKPSNVLMKMSCQCGDINVLLCSCCKQGFAVKLTGLSSSKVGYNSLYASGLDCRSFGHLVLNIFVGNYGQKFKGPENIYCANNLMNELRTSFADTPGLYDVVQRCFQVGPNHQSTAEELLHLDFFKY